MPIAKYQMLQKLRQTFCGPGNGIAPGPARYGRNRRESEQKLAKETKGRSCSPLTFHLSPFVCADPFLLASARAWSCATSSLENSGLTTVPSACASFAMRSPASSKKMKKLLCISALLALVGSCFAGPVRIVAYGDSITYGWIPNANPPSTRYGPEDRWPGALQKELGDNYQVIRTGRLSKTRTGIFGHRT